MHEQNFDQYLQLKKKKEGLVADTVRFLDRLCNRESIREALDSWQEGDREAPVLVDVLNPWNHEQVLTRARVIGSTQVNRYIVRGGDLERHYHANDLLLVPLTDL